MWGKRWSLEWWAEVVTFALLWGVPFVVLLLWAAYSVVRTAA